MAKSASVGLTLHGSLKARFKYIRVDLEGVLARLTDEDLTWAPAPTMRTISGQFLEIGNKEKETIGWLQGGDWPDDSEDVFDTGNATVRGIWDTLLQLRKNTYAYLDSLTDQQLNATVENPNLWWEGMRIEHCPISEVFRNIASHEWYHTGQLISYLWMRGDNPNDWEV